MGFIKAAHTTDKLHVPVFAPLGTWLNPHFLIFPYSNKNLW